MQKKTLMFLNSVLMASFVLCMTSCLSGARTSLVMRTAKYPVSMSRAVRDQNGQLASANRRKKVGHFETQFKAWSIFFGGIQLSKETDISRQINEQVEQVGGEAVNNVRVAVGNCGINDFAFFPLLPFLPGCLVAIVQGDIIRLEPK